MTPEEKIAKATKLLEEAKAELQKKDVVYVPDCIEITKPPQLASMGIKNGKQELFYNEITNLFGVNSNSLRKPVKCKLVKVNSEDREVGKIYYETDEDDFRNIKDLENYKIYLGERKYIRWTKYCDISTVFIGNSIWKHTYEVVAV